jgi:hypothetical protein
MGATTADDGACASFFRSGRTTRPDGAAKVARSMTHRGRGAVGRVVHDLWAWLTGTAYRPERHYMRGGRQSAVGAAMGR